jgi:hypothetical protein
MVLIEKKFMYNITLLSSFHIEHGKCNSEELYKIIEKINPEIIFEELSCQVFEIIYTEGYSPQSLEAISIKKYLKKFQIKHIPVDTYEKNESDFFNGYDIIANKSIAYTELFSQQLSMTSQCGYSFLNSNHFTELLDKMHRIEAHVLLELNDPKLSAQYKLDSEVHNKRDTEML